MASTLQQLRVANFGRTKLNATGSSGVGYQLIRYDGSVLTARTTSGVYQTAPGIYAAYINFPDDFRGQVLWDTGTAFDVVYYASEQHNTEENLPDAIYDKLVAIDDKVDNLNNSLSGSIDVKIDALGNTINAIYHMTTGRWKIENNQMIFYKDDNVTEVMRFDLFDDLGAPTMDAVFDRRKVI
jgi:hypothetical protein